MKFTEWIAVYAAILSTLTFLWNLNVSRSKVKVSILPGLDKPDAEGKERFGVYVAVRNPSNHTVHITSIGIVHNYRPVSLVETVLHSLEFRRWNRYTLWVHTSEPFENIETGAPVSIEPRSSHVFFVPEEAIKRMVENEPHSTGRFAAVAQDALWRNKYSRPYKLPNGGHGGEKTESRLSQMSDEAEP
ncbi:MAG: hypothetical protein R3C46_05820 [Hyphomonadaceae bacterium]